MDFLSIPLGEYVSMNLEFGKKLEDAPSIFSVNYFLRNKQGSFTNGIQDKRVWLKWIRQKTDNLVKGLKTPTGIIPKYEDLKTLFKEVLDKDYNMQDYIEQFSLRIPENLAKIERIRNIYKELKGIPEVLFIELDAQEKRLKECQANFGDLVKPNNLKEE